MFKLNDSQLDGEVRFSKAMCQFRQRIKESVDVPNPAEIVNKNTEASMLEVKQRNDEKFIAHCGLD